MATRDSNFARAHHLLDAKRLEQINHCLDLPLITRDFYDIRLGGHIDDLGPKDLGETEHFRPCFRLRMDLHEDHLAVHVRLFAEIGDFDDIDEPMQLLVDLLQDLVITRGDERNP